MYFNIGSEKQQRPIDLTILIPTAVLLLIGVVMSYSATLYKLNLNPESKKLFFISKEFIRVFLGILVFFIGSRINPKSYRKYIDYFTIFIAIVLAIMLFVGFAVHGARRWIATPLFPVQPSEIAKIALIFFLSHKISSDRQKVKNPIELLKVLILPLLIILLVVAQPNVSMALIMFAIVIGILFFAGVNLSYIIVPTFLALAFLLIITVTPIGLFRHVKERTLSFFTRGAGSIYQTYQARIAIASGGLFGKGIGRGVQKYFYLPFVESDFIFALIGEELGFFWATLIILLYAIIVLRGITVAIKHLNFNLYYSLLAGGISLMIFLSTFIHIGVNLGLLPPTGQTLPLVSLGGTSLVVNMFAVGVLEFLSEEAQRYETF